MTNDESVTREIVLDWICLILIIADSVDWLFNCKNMLELQYPPFLHFGRKIQFWKVEYLQ